MTTKSNVTIRCDSCERFKESWPSGLAGHSKDGVVCPECVDWHVVMENVRVAVVWFWV